MSRTAIAICVMAFFINGCACNCAKRQPGATGPSEPRGVTVTTIPDGAGNGGTGGTKKSRVVHEESTTSVQVLESRPVIGSDAEMGN